MKSYLWLILLITIISFIIISCTEPADTGSNDIQNTHTPNTAVEIIDETDKTDNTKIDNSTQNSTISDNVIENSLSEFSIHAYISYNQFNHLIEYKAGLEEEYTFSGDLLRIIFIFNNKIELDSLKNKLLINDGELTDYKIDGNEYLDDRYYVSLSFDRISDIVDYKFFIPKEIKDINGSELQDDILFTIHAYPTTTAAYSLITEAGELESIDPRIYDLEFSWLHLTSTPKTFNITFSNDVNQESVINSIKQGLKGKVNFTYRWLNDRTLEVRLDGFEVQKYMDNVFAISLEQGKDINGNKIIDDLNFRVGLPNTLGYIDLETLRTVELYTTEDYKVIADNMGHIDDYVILYDSKTKEGNLFNINTKLIERNTSALGTMVQHGNINWVGKNIAISFDEANKKIIRVDLANNIITDVVDVANIGINYEAYVKIKEIRLSPNGEKLAFIVGEYPETPKIFIYTYKEKAWTQYNLQAYYMGWPMPFIYAELKWADNQHLQYITSEPLKTNTLERLNVETGKKETIISGNILAHNEDESIYIISRPVEWQYGTAYRFFILKDNEEILINENKLVVSQDRRSLTNFHFLNENEVIYNDSQYERNDKVFLYNITDRTEKVIGTGKITGLSHDGKILTISDYESDKNLLTIYDKNGNKNSTNFNGRIIGISSDLQRIYFLSNYEYLYAMP